MWSVKSARKQSSLVDELKPTLIVARALGLAPYSFANNNLNRSTIAACYSLVVNMIYVYVTYTYLAETTFSSWEQKLIKMRVFRSILMAPSLHFSFISSLLGHRRLCRFINDINKFDAMVNLNPITRKRTVIEWAKVLSPIFLYTIIAMEVFYSKIDEPNWWVITNTLIHIGNAVNVCKYASIVSCLLRRFQHINHLVLSAGRSPIFVPKSSKLRDIWILHAHLTDAAEEFNSIFSLEVLIWIFALSVNLITRIYSLWSDMFRHIVLTSGTAIICFLILTYLLATCHVTAAEVNKVGKNLYCGSSNPIPEAIESENEDSYLIGQYFVLRRFKFTAGSGMLTIDLPLLLTILGAISSYLVILKSGTLTGIRK